MIEYHPLQIINLRSALSNPNQPLQISNLRSAAERSETTRRRRARRGRPAGRINQQSPYDTCVLRGREIVREDRSSADTRLIIPQSTPRMSPVSMKCWCIANARPKVCGV
jgi:hypothetical protein